MKRIFIITAAVAAIMLASGSRWFTANRPAPGHVNGPRILAAAQTYAHDLQARGQTVPPSVAVQDLIAKGLLSPADVSGFAGQPVTVSLPVDTADPNATVMRVRMQDGSQVALVADGSVQTLSR
jgi:hypothetical protein